jgi:hypothetical protein
MRSGAALVAVFITAAHVGVISVKPYLLVGRVAEGRSSLPGRLQVLAAFIGACHDNDALCLDCIHRLEFVGVPQDKALTAMRTFQFMLCTTRAVNLATILKDDNA